MADPYTTETELPSHIAERRKIVNSDGFRDPTQIPSDNYTASVQRRLTSELGQIEDKIVESKINEKKVSRFQSLYGVVSFAIAGVALAIGTRYNMTHEEINLTVSGITSTVFGAFSIVGCYRYKDVVVVKRNTKENIDAYNRQKHNIGVVVQKIEDSPRIQTVGYDHYFMSKAEEKNNLIVNVDSTSLPEKVEEVEREVVERYA